MHRFQRLVLPSVFIVLLFASNSLAQSTIYSTASSDGWVSGTVSTFDSFCYGGTSINPTTQLVVGRASDWYRSFVSFDISSLAGRQITSVTLSIYQPSIVGDPYGTGGPIVTDLLDYGSTLDTGDFCRAALSTGVGTISSNSAVGFKNLNVTSSITYLLGLNATRAQFRFRSQNEASVSGYANFEAAEAGVSAAPRLQVTFGNEPDLFLGPSSFSPADVRAGDLFTVNARVQNNGNAVAGQSRLEFFVAPDPANANGYKIGETSVEALQPGAFADKTLSIPFPSSIPSGSYKIAFWVDAGSQVAESDERDYFWLNSPVLTVSPACTYSISPQDGAFGFNGGVGNITVTAATGCTWNASSNASWITITSGSSGIGNGAVSFSVGANSSTSGRSATMTIAGRTFSITQGGAPSCSYAISPAGRTHGPGVESGTIAVSASSGCSWTAVSNANWITASGASGSGLGAGDVVNYSLAANSSGSSRTGTITIATQIFTVTQTATPSCTYASSPASRSHGAGSETGIVTVSTASGCAWIAQSNASWITITSGSSGTGNGTVVYAVAANSSTSVRTGTVTIAGQLFTVTQSASASSTPVLLYAPQIAAGIDGAALGEWVTIIELTNLSANPTEVSWSYFSPAGNGAPLTLSHSTNGQPTGDRSTSLVLLSGRSSVYYELKSSQTVRAGWARFEVPTDFSGNALVGVAVIYHLRGFDGRVRASVGVPVSKAMTSATLQIRIAQGVGMALAIANPDQSSGLVSARTANVDLRLYDSVGIVGFSAPLLESIVLPVKPGEQIARYVSELFKSRPTDPRLPLSLEIYSDVPIVITAIRFDADLPSSVPLLPGRPR